MMARPRGIARPRFYAITTLLMNNDDATCLPFRPEWTFMRLLVLKMTNVKSFTAYRSLIIILSRLTYETNLPGSAV